MANPLIAIIEEIVQRTVREQMDAYFADLTTGFTDTKRARAPNRAKPPDTRYQPIPDAEVTLGSMVYIKLNGFVQARVMHRDGTKWVVKTPNGAERRATTCYELTETPVDEASDDDSEELPMMNEVDPDADDSEDDESEDEPVPPSKSKMAIKDVDDDPAPRAKPSNLPLIAVPPNKRKKAK